MTDLNQSTEVNVDNVDNVDNVEPMKAEFTPDDLRVELDKLMDKLRVSEVEVERNGNALTITTKKIRTSRRAYLH